MMMDHAGLKGLGMCIDWRTNNSCIQTACDQGPVTGVTTSPPPASSSDYSWLVWLVVVAGLLVVFGGDDKK